jgi:APA family basic amino acid/polyamine antiporter
MACLGLMWQLPQLTWIRFVVWTIVGVIVYLGYGLKHSKLSAETTSPHGSEPV